MLSLVIFSKQIMYSGWGLLASSDIIEQLCTCTYWRFFPHFFRRWVAIVVSCLRHTRKKSIFPTHISCYPSLYQSGRCIGCQQNIDIQSFEKSFHRSLKTCSVFLLKKMLRGPWKHAVVWKIKPKLCYHVLLERNDFSLSSSSKQPVLVQSLSNCTVMNI